MNHKALLECCEGLGLAVRQMPDSGRKSFNATFANAAGVRVYWSTSLEGGLLGLPRVSVDGRDTHARSCREVQFLVNGRAVQS